MEISAEHMNVTRVVDINLMSHHYSGMAKCDNRTNSPSFQNPATSVGALAYMYKKNSNVVSPMTSELIMFLQGL